MPWFGIRIDARPGLNAGSRRCGNRMSGQLSSFNRLGMLCHDWQLEHRRGTSRVTFRSRRNRRVAASALHYRHYRQPGRSGPPDVTISAPPYTIDRDTIPPPAFRVARAGIGQCPGGRNSMVLVFFIAWSISSAVMRTTVLLVTNLLWFATIERAAAEILSGTSKTM